MTGITLILNRHEMNGGIVEVIEVWRDNGMIATIPLEDHEKIDVQFESRQDDPEPGDNVLDYERLADPLHIPGIKPR